MRRIVCAATLTCQSGAKATLIERMNTFLGSGFKWEPNESNGRFTITEEMKAMVEAGDVSLCAARRRHSWCFSSGFLIIRKPFSVLRRQLKEEGFSALHYLKTLKILEERIFKPIQFY